MILEPGQIALQPGGRGQNGSAAKHGSHAAEGAPKAAAERRLISRCALPQEGPGQISSAISQQAVRQHRWRAAIGESPIGIVHRYSVSLPAQSRYGIEVGKL